MPERVLVPFDGSPLSRRALEWTVTELPAAAPVVLYVADQQTDPTADKGHGDHPGEWEDWLADREAHADDLFEVATEIAVASDATVETRFGVGRLVREILDAVESTGADLVVIGLHGRERFGEFAPGSTAEAILRKSPVPVVVVRNPPGSASANAFGGR